MAEVKAASPTSPMGEGSSSPGKNVRDQIERMNGDAGSSKGRWAGWKRKASGGSDAMWDLGDAWDDTDLDSDRVEGLNVDVNDSNAAETLYRLVGDEMICNIPARNLEATLTELLRYTKAIEPAIRCAALEQIAKLASFLPQSTARPTISKTVVEDALSILEADEDTRVQGWAAFVLAPLNRPNDSKEIGQALRFAYETEQAEALTRPRKASISRKDSMVRALSEKKVTLRRRSSVMRPDFRRPRQHSKLLGSSISLQDVSNLTPLERAKKDAESLPRWKEMSSDVGMASLLKRTESQTLAKPPREYHIKQNQRFLRALLALIHRLDFTPECLAMEVEGDAEDLKGGDGADQIGKKDFKGTLQFMQAMSSLVLTLYENSECEDSETGSDTENFMDSLLSKVLTDSKELDDNIVAAVINAFSLLPQTPGVRRRVNKILQPMASMLLRILSENTKVQLDPACSRFWSKWCPFPSDNRLLELYNDRDRLTGYANKRLGWLRRNQNGSDKRVIELRDLLRFSSEYATRGVFQQANWITLKTTDGQPISDTISFDDATTSRWLVIENHMSDQGEAFRILLKCTPQESFTCTPTLCVVEPGVKKKVCITFHPQITRGRSQTITGNVRVYNHDGLTLGKRILLQGHNPPLLRIATRELTFGFCPLGESRSGLISITNIGGRSALAEISVLQSEGEPAFHIHAAVKESSEDSRHLVSVGENDQRLLQIEFRPRDDIKFDAMLKITVSSLEQYMIKLSGTGGSMLDIFPPVLDCGHLHPRRRADFSSSILITNCSEECAMPVYPTCPSPYVTIEPFVVPAKEQTHLKLMIEPTHEGPFETTITLCAPNSDEITVDVKGYVGPRIAIPVGPKVYLPPCTLDSKRTAIVPVQNRTSSKVKVKVKASTLRSSGFLVTLIGTPELGEEDKNEEEEAPEEQESADIVTIIHKYEHINLEVSFFNETEYTEKAEYGIFRGIIEVHYMEPAERKATECEIIGILMPNMISSGLPYQDGDRFTRQLLEYLHDSSTENMPFEDFGPVIFDPYKSGSELFERRTMDIFRDTERGRPMGKCALSPIPKSDFICVVASPGLELGLGRASWLKVDMEEREDLIVYTNDHHVGSESTYSGFLAGISMKGQLVDTIPIFAASGSRLTVKCPRGSLTIDHCYVNESKGLDIMISNLISSAMKWKAAFQGIGANAAAQLIPKAGTIDAFTTLTARIRFQSQSKGSISSLLSVMGCYEGDTRKPFEANMAMQAIVGSTQIGVSPMLLNFDNVLTDKRYSKTLTVTNFSEVHAYVTCTAPAGFSLNINYFELRPREETVLKVTCAPQEDGYMGGLIAVSTSTNSLHVAVAAQAGSLRLTSNYGPSNIDDFRKAIFMGFIDKGMKSTACPVIVNTGTLPAPLVSVTAHSDALRWQLLNYTGSKAKSRREIDVSTPFRIENDDEEEIDWDELEHNFMDSEVQNLPIHISPGQALVLDLNCRLETPGVFEDDVTLWVRQQDEKTPFRFSCRAVLQPRPQLSETKVKFGVCPVNCKTIKTVVLSNDGLLPTPWKLEIEQEDATTEEEADDEDSFICRPCRGYLMPQQQQEIQVEFTPTGNRSEYGASFRLSTAYELPSTHLHVIGTGATSKVSVTPQQLSFGCVRAGDQKSLEILLENEGLLESRFTFRNLSGPFDVQPTQGKVSSRYAVPVKVTFSAQGTREVTSNPQIHFSDQRGDQIFDLMWTGRGGFPKIHVPKVHIFFGKVAHMQRYSQKFDIVNQGDAEAIIHLELPSHDVSVKLNGEIVDILHVKEKSSVSLEVIFTPSDVEKLDQTLVIASPYAHGSRIPVQLRADIGHAFVKVSPGLPASVLDFGVVLYGKLSKREFKISNSGDADASYELLFLREPKRAQQSGVPSTDLASYRKMKSVSGFVLSHPPQGVLRANEHMILQITYSPERPGHIAESVLCFKSATNIFWRLKGMCGDYDMELDMDDLDFGICHIGNHVRQKVKMNNKGTMDFNWHISVDSINTAESNGVEQVPGLMTVAKVTQDARQKLLARGCQIEPMSGTCRGKNTSAVHITFHPASAAVSACEVRFHYPEGSKVLRLKGQGGKPTLQLYLNETQGKMKPILDKFFDFGICGVGQEHHRTVFLRNDGNMLCEYLLDPKGESFDVFPTHGKIAPSGSNMIRLTFSPRDEHPVSGYVRILPLGLDPFALKLHGHGGHGHIDVEFCDKRDNDTKSMDFGTMPVNCPGTRTFVVINRGSVPVMCTATSMTQQFSLRINADSITSSKFRASRELKKTGAISWNKPIAYYPKLSRQLGPGEIVKIDVQMLSQREGLFNGEIQVQCEYNSAAIPVKGNTATVNINFKGSLRFGRVAPRFAHKRRMEIHNKGSIAAPVALFWILRNHKEYFCPGSQELIQVSRVHERWTMAIEYSINVVRKKRGVELMKPTINPLKWRQEWAFQEGDLDSKPTEHFHKLMREAAPLSQDDPQISVSPSYFILKEGAKQSLDVTLNPMLWQRTFDATLMAKVLLPGVPVSSFLLEAEVQSGTVFVDNSTPLVFGKQHIGSRTILKRTFKNMYPMDIHFRIRSDNSALSYNPSEGVIPHQGIAIVSFIFIPSNEFDQVKPIFFECDSQSPIKLDVVASGGIAKLELEGEQLTDFGKCVIGLKRTEVFKVRNDGDASINIQGLSLNQSECFYKGEGWPENSTLEISPGTVLDLPVTFRPTHEDTFNSVLRFTSFFGKTELKFVGAGKPEMLLVSPDELLIRDCIVGKTYFKTLEVSNASDGDVTLEVKVQCSDPTISEKLASDISITPDSLALTPFSKRAVTIIFRPQSNVNVLYSKDPKALVILTALYSNIKVPLLLQAGTANVNLDPKILDFGHFEARTLQQRHIQLSNTGTMAIHYSMNWAENLPFKISLPHGKLAPGKPIDIVVELDKKFQGPFNDEVVIDTELDREHFVFKVKGHADESVLEFEPSSVDFGACPVKEITNRKIIAYNRGGLPLEFALESSMPLKVTPVSGVIEPGTSIPLNLKWSPKRVMQLQSNVKLINVKTNEQFIIEVIGWAAHPEFSLDRSILDFGVCAIGQTISRSLKVINTGKTPISWKIPDSQEPFHVSALEGRTKSKSSEPILVSFTPQTPGKWTSVFLLNTKTKYRQFHCFGIGAKFEVSIEQQNILLEDLPACTVRRVNMPLKNTGEVQAALTLQIPQQHNLEARLSLTELILEPGQCENLQVRVQPLEEGEFVVKVKVVSELKEWEVQISGKATSESADLFRIIRNECLLALKTPHALADPREFVPAEDPDVEIQFPLVVAIPRENFDMT